MIARLSHAQRKHNVVCYYSFGEIDNIQNIIEIIPSFEQMRNRWFGHVSPRASVSRVRVFTVTAGVPFTSYTVVGGRRPRPLNLRIFRKTSRYATTMWVSAQVRRCTFAHFVRSVPRGIAEISAPRKIKYRIRRFSRTICPLPGVSSITWRALWHPKSCLRV